MGRFKDIYKRNIYGVMGTLVFHILLFSVFLLAEVDMKGNIQQDELLIEFPEELLTEPELPEETPEEVTPEEEESLPNDPASRLSSEQSAKTNIASKRLAESEKFFDEDYTDEVEAARRLVSDVNRQLSKETVDLEDIDMPVETTTDMNPDSIKNIIYTGESNIVYYLEGRYHLSLPIPVYLAQGGGKVIVDIVVDREGKVVQAEPRNNPSVRDGQIYLYATAAASRTLFNKDPDAPEIQRGTINYTFIAQ
jgi:hypothetical protein